MTTQGLAPEKLYLLQLSRTTVPVPSGKLEMVLGCYLVVTGDGKHILIDTGFPPDVPGKPPGENDSDVIKQLADLRLSPDDIEIVIATHFDIDHVGYHDRFAKAEFIVQREHYTLARSGHRRFAAGRAHWDHPALRYRQVDGDTELLPGLTLVESSGHTPGHQSVLVRLPKTGPVLLAIDAVMLERLFTPERKAWPLDDNEEHLRASTRKLMGLVETEHVALVVFGHDGMQWQLLKKSPAFYD